MTPLLTGTLQQADLNLPLPFRDNQFDRVVCNLVLGYLQDPLFTLGELMRVLGDNGRLVLTNLKPQSDLSQIYRNFIERTKEPAEIEEGRQLLSNSGKIKQGESDGIFRFFDRQELATLLISVGVKQPRIYTTFANQAYIAVAEKTTSTERPPEAPSRSIVQVRTHG
jgi:ubiquinone/menaquinone biosynthesis C-methylase UbiE